jgi:DNA-binding NarL/FixJ family response regulator
MTLTSRELELVEMVKRDLSNKEIGQLLRVSPRTIELHRTRIRKKLGLTGRTVRLPAHLRSL